MGRIKNRAALFLTGVLLGCLSGCGREAPLPRQNEYLLYTSYRDIPEVSEEEIAAIESLRASTGGFVYGMSLSTETFYNEDNEVAGYSALFCDWLTGLFGIPFKPAIYEWNDLIAGLESREIDFSGELTATEERREKYYMTSAIVERPVKFMRLAGRELPEIVKSRPLRYAFLEGTVTYNQVAVLEQRPFEVFFTGDYQTAYSMLKKNQIDAFFDEGVVEAAFDSFDDVVAEEFLPLIYSPVSLASQNPRLEPFISVVEKAIQSGGAYQLSGIYNQGHEDYLRHKLFARLDAEERDYILDRIHANRPVPVAAEYDNYPLSFYNTREREWQGIAFDVLTRIKALTGLSFVMANREAVEWPDLLDMLERGEAAMITELIRSEEREGRFVWPDVPFQTDYYALLSRSEYKHININEVLYSRIGLIKNTAYAETFYLWFPKHPAAREYISTGEAFKALERGEVDMVMATRNLLLSLTNLQEHPGFKVNFVFNYPYESTFGFNSEERVLSSIVSKALRLIDTEQISDSWIRRVFDYRGKMAQVQIPWLVGVSGLLFCLLALLLVMLLRRRLERKKLERTVQERTNELVRQDRLLHTVNDAASLLLASDADKFEDALRQGMEMMAQGVAVDRIYVWKKILQDGILCYRQTFEWLNAEAALREDTVRAIALKDSHDFPYIENIPEWETRFSGGLCVNGPMNTLSPFEQKRLAPYGIKSILVIPVSLQDTFWGFVSFDDCFRERMFSKDEEDILRSGSLLLANAVIRNETTQALRTTAVKAEAASRAKSDFLSNMSHEMRTPMNAIIGMTSIAKNSSDAERKDYCLHKIEDASVHLLGVINDILDMSKIEANRFELSIVEFDFEKMLQKVANIINFRVDEKRQNFTIYIDRNIPRYVIGDDLRFAQVITNLLGNAVKFTPEKGSISLSARLAGEEKDLCTIQIEVSDTGIGISEKQQSRLFTSFEQAESSTSRKFGGTGLGLAISKRIVELMGGKIWIKSSLGRGASFFFTVQVKTGRGMRQIFLHAGKDWKNIRILVVDDWPETGEYFREILLGFGVPCDTAGSGEAALELIERNGPYDICFVDWKMPGMDGLDLSRRIKKQNPEKSVIMMISAAEWNSIEADAKDAGVDNFLPKPLFPSAIAGCINECLGLDNLLAAEKNQPGKMDNFAGRRVLLAEDVEINREIVFALLEPTAVAIDCAENGEEAVRMFKAAPESYDMIFMDVQMPKMDGCQAAQAIRAFEKERGEKITALPHGIPIIAMTANVFREDIQKCLAAGMNGHVGKPLNLEEVLAQLRLYLRPGKPPEASLPADT
jgi:signal transduction histidine kinase/CheY-like chemotaxis protein/ABC-type amino acid transport substrate-binding protein